MEKRANVLADVTKAGATEDVIKATDESLKKNFPGQAYELAVWFLGIATIVLIVGAVLESLFAKTTSDAMWAVAGAGIGGLAGIFTGKS